MNMVASTPDVTPPRLPARLALALGGGGLKGFAHIGVLQALEERGIRPQRVAGTSIGALMAAAWVAGMSTEEMASRAMALTKRDLFRIDHLNMVVRRMLSPSLYLEGPLQALIDEVVPPGSFERLRTELLVNTVDLERGAPLVWGLPGLRDVAVRDAVYASCALPGFFPPREIRGHTCVDGGVIDNVPHRIAAAGMDAIIAVDVGSSSLAAARRVREKGFAAIYMRAAQTMMKSLNQAHLQAWDGPPMLLVRPAVWRFNWFSFAHTRRMIEAGYEATLEALDRVGDALCGAGGIHPRRVVEVSVDRERCTGCGLCAVLAPEVMAMDGEGKAVVRRSPLEWSRADGEFVHECPEDAIRAESVEQGRRRPTLQVEEVVDE